MSLLRVAVVVGVALAMPAIADAAPRSWSARCGERLTKAVGTLGKARVTVTPPKPRGQLHEAGVVGTVVLTIDSVAGRMRVTAGEDDTGRRYRGRRGIEEKRYEAWHSPYVDSLGGDPPKGALAIDEELHHRLTLGVVWARIVVDGKPRAAATAFVDAAKAAIEACFADVTPEEDNPTLRWTTQCEQALAAAHAKLVKVDPFFATATCKHEAFGAMCLRIDGDEPHWGAVTSIYDPAHPPRGWFAQGVNRSSYGEDVYHSASLLWAGPQMPAAQYQRLSDAMRPALEACATIMRANSF